LIGVAVGASTRYWLAGAAARAAIEVAVWPTDCALASETALTDSAAPTAATVPTIA
jgi:hypothetical protein